MKPTYKVLFKIYKNAVLFFILIMICSDCSISPKFKKAFYHDQMHPCTKDSYLYDSLECEAWKVNYPKQYKRYLERNPVAKDSTGVEKK